MNSASFASYGEALEKQIALARRWANPSWQWAAEHIRQQVLAADGAAPSLADLCEQYMHELEHGETYFVSNDLVDVIYHASTSLPESPMTNDLPLTSHGFVWLEHGILMPYVPDGPSHLRAWSWEPVLVQDPHGKPLPDVPSYSDFGQFLSITFYGDHEHGDGLPLCCGNCLWPYGASWSGWSPAAEACTGPAIDNQHEALVFLRRFVMSFYLWIRQEIFIAPQQQAPRAVRKRLARQHWYHNPVIRVVELRRRTPTHAKQDTTEQIEWSCRWIVAGHWRQQWYAGLGVHQPKWIMPYVKGPEDKPLKTPGARVFAVVQ